MKKILSLILALQIALSISFETRADETSGSDTSKPAVKVNGEVITMGEVDSIVKRQPAFAFYSKMGNSDPSMLNDFRWNEIQEIIGKRLLEQEIKRSNLIKDEELNKIFEQKVESEFGGKERIDTIVKALRADPVAFTQELKNQVMVATYAERAIAPEVKITSEDIAKAIEQNPKEYDIKTAVHARHILIKTSPPGPDGVDSPDAKKKIDEIYAKSKAPAADFSALAKEFSACPSAPKGGDLGFFEAGMMVPEFEKAAFALKPGEISQPIKTQFGYHIIKVEERREPSPEAQREKVRANLTKNQIALKIKEKIEALRKVATIEILLPPRKQIPQKVAP